MRSPALRLNYVLVSSANNDVSREPSVRFSITPNLAGWRAAPSAPSIGLVTAGYFRQFWPARGCTEKPV